ncbi:protein of unknown function [uncultured Woeseiaceae bacterium]|uniref:Uncharacterized protein n=1 Tax=uncultured Woeseiaceae bacterium TaxID=1983305 RepID=A0A7D9H330_9GAMM|nr:protein of unknown function [uncultured Woeseiaceae bacterium]
MEQGKIVAPAASEKANFSASGEDTWLKAHPGPKNRRPILNSQQETCMKIQTQ